MKHNIFSVFFVFFLTFHLFGVAQKHLHNGFVAATSTGVWYLQDGFNEWISLGIPIISYSNKVNTNSAISFYNEKLISDFWNYSYHCIPNIYGLGLFENYYFDRGEYVFTYKNKMLTNKYKRSFKHLKSTIETRYPVLGWTEIDLQSVNDDLSIVINDSEIEYSTFIITSLATDNDSILVWTGTNNVLYKTVISPTVGYRSNTSISGLVSSASSGHQICYDSNNDLFWIVSDEGVIYSYDKSTVTLSEDTIYYCDSVLDVCYDEYLNTIGVTYHNTADDLIEFILPDIAAEETNLSGNSQCVSNNNGIILINSDNEIVKYNCISGEFDYSSDDLPSGTVVYDLDYIDYLPAPPSINPGDTLTEITIGTQIWMQYNLHIDDGEGGIYSYNDEPDSSDIYGYLYTWNAAMRLDTLINGWHLPSDVEWTTLTDFLTNNGYGYGGSGSDIAKSVATTSRWLASAVAGTPGNNQTSNNSSGLSLSPGGFRYLEPVEGENYGYINYGGSHWSSTIYDTDESYQRTVNYNNATVVRNHTQMMYPISVRLIKDTP